jgi:hypothetical protein
MEKTTGKPVWGAPEQALSYGHVKFQLRTRDGCRAKNRRILGSPGPFVWGHNRQKATKSKRKPNSDLE